MPGSLSPLIHLRRLHGLLVLGTPRVPSALGWEELDLMKTIGAQAASYLAEESTSRALTDARRLEEFNQRFAFVVHDIKNVVSQMRLMLSNAEAHGTDPEFQRDMLVTVASSAARLQKMLVQVAAERRVEPQASGPVDLVPLLRGIYERWRANYEHLIADGLDGAMVVLASEGDLVSAVDHLLQNAIEASSGGGPVRLSLRRDGHEAIVEVRDRGPGMDAEFIRTQLFRPLETWKAQGMGLGAFQVRQMTRGMGGGRLEVDSRPGDGTVMRMRLRLQPAPVAEAMTEGECA